MHAPRRPFRLRREQKQDIIEEHRIPAHGWSRLVHAQLVQQPLAHITSVPHREALNERRCAPVVGGGGGGVRLERGCELRRKLGDARAASVIGKRSLHDFAQLMH